MRYWLKRNVFTDWIAIGFSERGETSQADFCVLSVNWEGQGKIEVRKRSRIISQIGKKGHLQLSDCRMSTRTETRWSLRTSIKTVPTLSFGRNPRGSSSPLLASSILVTIRKTTWLRWDNLTLSVLILLGFEYWNIYLLSGWNDSPPLGERSRSNRRSQRNQHRG